MSDRLPPSGLTDDAALGGRLRLLQPRRGHRFGHDGVLLAAAAAVPADARVVDLGAGVGIAGLALAVRLPATAVTLVERDPVLTALAQDNIRRNGLAGRVRAMTLDATSAPAAFEAAGLAPESVDAVIMNPPFNDPARQRASPQAARAHAHMADAGELAAWCGTARTLLAPGGTLTLIWRADGLLAVLDALQRGFGGPALIPVHARPETPAIRVLARAEKGSRAPLHLLPGLYLNTADGKPSALAEAILRDAAPLSR